LKKCLAFRKKQGKTSVPLYLEEQVMKWPTPTSRDWKGAYSAESQAKKERRLLPDVVAGTWPTPTTRDWKDGGTLPPSRTTVSRQTLPQRLAYLGQQDQAKSSSSGKNQESWVTPTASQAEKPQGPNSQQKGLQSQVRKESWATPNTMDSLPQRSEEALRRQAQTARKGRKKPANLREQVDPKAVEIYKEESKQWPTARVSDVEGGRIKTQETDKGFRSRREKSDQWFGAKLRDAVETHEANWATPQTRDHRSGDPKRWEDEKRTKNLNDQQSVTNAKLNPNWVEHLMGVPPQWTQLPTEWID
tara:strand:- start:411 stop:1319 length:909 start_codon:yes stop_codon:yes gene_type:complete